MTMYDQLMEMVIEDELDIAYIQEGVLNKAGLNKEDLSDPDKVKKAISNLNGITSEFERRSMAIAIFTAVLQAINSIIGLFGKTGIKGKVANVLAGLLIQIISESAKYHFGISDYRKLLNKIDNQIRKTTDKIASINKSENPDREALKELEDLRENLRKSKDEVLKRMKQENRIEGKDDEKINPEPENPMRAFTGLLV